MKQVALYYLYLFFSAVVLLQAASCTDSTDTPLSAGADIEEGGLVKVLFTTSSGSEATTRAEVPGWNGDWNENKVERLDLFVFDGEGTFQKHYGSTVEYDYDGSGYESSNSLPYETWEIPAAELSPSDIPNDAQVYLIANCPSLGNRSFSMLSALLSALSSVDDGDPQLKINDYNDLFIMDGKGDVTWDDNDVTLSFDLSRAAAKVLLSFSSDTSWDDVTYRFVNYATTTSILADGEDAHLGNEDFRLSSMDEFASATTLYDNSELVLYSYANNWFDSSITVNVDEPIDPDKQTYIMLHAPYEGTDYYYKVPLNYRLPQNNDEVGIDSDSYKDLYRVQRNYIYDITVSIDRAGGPTESTSVEPTLNYSVVAWQEQDIRVPSFE